MFSDYFRGPRLFSRDVRLVVIVYGLFGFGWGGLYVLLYNLYLLRLGHDAEFIGFVNAAGRLACATSAGTCRQSCCRLPITLYFTTDYHLRLTGNLRARGPCRPRRAARM